MDLARSQLVALGHKIKYARNHEHEATATINHILKSNLVVRNLSEIFEKRLLK